MSGSNRNIKYKFVLLKGGKQMNGERVEVFDVAKYILEKLGSMTTMKLQKLVYYCQAWSLVWDGVPLFEEDFEAWANGPVCPALFEYHRGMFMIDAETLKRGDSSKLNQTQRETIDSVLEFYGDKDPHWLSLLTHKERPWREARMKANVLPGEPCNEIITKESMQDYYGGLE